MAGLPKIRVLQATRGIARKAGGGDYRRVGDHIVCAGFGPRAGRGGFVARKTDKRKETKTEFLRRLLGRNPDLDHHQINQRWVKAGHAGEISNALFYQVRSKMGIRTEWRWVKESEPEATEPARAETQRQSRPNDDLVEAAETALPYIVMFYKRFEDKRPVMLLDLPDEKIYAYPYEGFKADLSPRSQAELESEYERALAEGKIVVFVRDNETRRLVSMSFDNE